MLSFFIDFAYGLYTALPVIRGLSNDRVKKVGGAFFSTRTAVRIKPAVGHLTSSSSSSSSSSSTTTVPSSSGHWAELVASSRSKQFKIGPKLQCKTNVNSYAVYRAVPRR